MSQLKLITRSPTTQPTPPLSLDDGLILDYGVWGYSGCLTRPSWDWNLGLMERFFLIRRILGRLPLTSHSFLFFPFEDRVMLHRESIDGLLASPSYPHKKRDWWLACCPSNLTSQHTLHVLKNEPYGMKLAHKYQERRMDFKRDKNRL